MIRQSRSATWAVSVCSLACLGEVVRSNTAIGYEFGSRRGLVDAILAERGDVCRVRRAHVYGRLRVGQYATFLGEGPSQWTVLALRVLEQLSLPDDHGAERARLGVGHVIASLEARARQRFAGVGGWTLAPLELFTANLVDMLHGSLVAPPSASTLAALALAEPSTHGP